MQEPEAEPEVVRDARESVVERHPIPVPTSKGESALLQENQGGRLERDLARKAEPLRQAAQRPEPGDKLYAKFLKAHLKPTKRL